MTAVDGRVVRGERNRQAIAHALLACYEEGLLRPSIPEVAGEAALYFDPNDPREMGEKILSLWQDAGLRDRLVADGREQARQFTARRMAEAHLEAFRFARENFFPEIRELYSRILYKPLEEWQHHAEHWRAQTENLWGRLAELERQVAELAREASVGRLVLTHFSQRYDDVAPLLAEARETGHAATLMFTASSPSRIDLVCDGT